MTTNPESLLAVTQAINEYLSLTGARVHSDDVYGASDHDLKIGLAEHILSTLPTEPASVREERLREALEHTRDELVRLAWDENAPLMVRIEAALSTEEPKL